MRLPLTWKLFHIANYVLLVSFLILLGIFLYMLVKAPYQKEFEVFNILFLLCSSLMVINTTTNLYIFYKHFPDKPLSKGIRSVHIFITVLYIVVLLALLILCVFGTSEEINSADEENTGKIALAILIVLFFVGCFVLVKQLQIRRFLKKNLSNSIDSLIESIGT